MWYSKRYKNAVWTKTGEKILFVDLATDKRPEMTKVSVFLGESLFRGEDR
jgi:hypothetical protein